MSCCFDISYAFITLNIQWASTKTQITVQKSFTLYFKYFRFQVANSVGYSVQSLKVTPVNLLHLHV